MIGDNLFIYLIAIAPLYLVSSFVVVGYGIVEVFFAGWCNKLLIFFIRIGDNFVYSSVIA